ncbi:acyl-CoA dehydrogenase family protein [Yinghuangia sp. ASG 101]|uniref:acyl-CoA dehydrogenase family protein n=1 Tax=Yinghuangia sp. ASG 101 TaxID=2896848 RepID=UPI001E2D0A3D|nr:acyl-CoA dehydrogenase family protein [Yinghuangia sp. ASG 101]UGQ11196.1 acyl-CoA dehydrogenase family protein [Yinghuangia sp. ASG 101]
MAWDFSTEPEFQEQLDWMRGFVDTEIERLCLLWPGMDHTPPPTWLRRVIDPLKQQVRDRGLWACHLGPELGGSGYGQVKLALMNEIIGRNEWAPTIFGVQGPDTGNAEILAHYGTTEQKERYLRPLLDGEAFSCFSMTEPQAGADPRQFTTRAVRDGDSWVITGEKFFSSNAEQAAFLIVMAVTDPDADPVRGMSMFLVPGNTPGIEVVRPTVTYGEQPGGMTHPHLRYNDVRVGADAMLGGEGQAFVVAQTRLGGGRVHHSMRAVAVATRAFEMMCERALSRRVRGGPLAERQLVQDAIARSWAEIRQYRLFVMHTAWMIDNASTADVRTEIAALKNMGAKLVHDVVERAVHIHGALGVSDETPLARMWMQVPMYGIWDGPTEVHTATVARRVLRGFRPAPGLWPGEWIPGRLAEARDHHRDALAEQATWAAARDADDSVARNPGARLG